MTPTITPQPDGTTAIDTDYTDEGVDLQGHTSVIGDVAAAEAYIPTFDADLRRTYSHLFPTPAPIEEES